MLAVNHIILGAIQGIFEWIPISSEGVVALASRFLVKEINPVQIALFLHLGTLLAALFYFRKEWRNVLVLKNPKLLRFLVLTTLISLIVSYPLYKLVKNMALGNGLLMIMGVGLLGTAYLHKSKKTSKAGPDKLAVVVGFLQGLSVIPGLSRSGATIFGLSLSKDDPNEILKVSYMMSVPVGLAAALYLFLENPNLVAEGWFGLLSSFVVGFIALRFLMKIAKRINFFRFALIFALFCFLGAAIGSVI